LNMFLYQERREQFVKDMKSDSATFDQKLALVQVEKHRLAEFPVTLSEDDYDLLNVHTLDSATKKFESNVYIHRTCDGELIATFMMDQAFFGDHYAIMYSERAPEKSEYTQWDEHGQPRTAATYTIEECEVEKIISPNWYYVRIGQPGMFDHLFDGMFDFGFGGGGGGGTATGGCN
ncbi:MAG TPA: hypothetical protein VK826_09910, partial [Bacteroidia bacterium]|nr:hypothetical protein [Bacteroidia bacterium]